MEEIRLQANPWERDTEADFKVVDRAEFEQLFDDKWRYFCDHRIFIEKGDNRYYLESYSVPLSVESASAKAKEIGEFLLAVSILGLHLISPPIITYEQRNIWGTIRERSYLLVTLYRPLVKRD